MNEERLMILKMLEQGKITAEQAVALLEAVKEREREAERETKAWEPWKTGEWGRKIEESVAQIVGRLQEAGVLVHREYRGRFGTPEMEATPSDQAPILIRLATRNGSIKVTGTDENEYLLRLHGRVRHPAGTRPGTAEGGESRDWLDSLVEAGRSEGGIQLDLTDPGLYGLHIELALPRDHRYQIALASENGSVGVLGHGLRCSTVTLETQNGGASAEGLAAEYVRIATENGSIRLDGLEATRGEATTANGGVRVRVGESPSRVQWRIATSNGSIKVAIPAGSVPCIFFRAQTRMGRVQVEAAPLVVRRFVHEHGHHYVEGFLGAEAAAGSAGLELDLETSNGSITIQPG